MRISDIMTRTPVCCAPETRIEEIARLMVTHDCGSIPICEGDDVKRVVGVITDRDIVVRAVAAGRNPLDHKAGDLMSHPVVVVQADAAIDEAIKVLEENQVRRAPVVDTTGQVVGVVAQADFARSAPSDKAAELVHEISQGIDIGHE